METADTWEKIRPTVRGITQFVFQQVATELAEPRIVSPKYWSTLRYDLEVYPF